MYFLFIKRLVAGTEPNTIAGKRVRPLVTSVSYKRTVLISYPYWILTLRTDDEDQSSSTYKAIVTRRLRVQY